MLYKLIRQALPFIQSMRSFLCLSFTVTFLSIESGQGADNPLGALPGPGRGTVSVYVRNIRNTYNNLRIYQENILTNGLHPANTNLRHYLELINQFERSLNQDRPPFTSPTDADSRRLLETLQACHDNINAFINQYNGVLREYNESLFSRILTKLPNRYRLGKIERIIRNQQGWMGQAAIDHIPDGGAQDIFRNTIRLLTGRIFIVNPRNNNPAIISTSSGIIVPQTDANGTITYDRLITCGHSMKPDETSPELELYFVRSEILDLRTGLPNSLMISQVINPAAHHTQAQADAAINNQHFIGYLRQESQNPHSNSVRRIVRFEAFSQPMHQPSLPEHHSPRYRPHQDNGYVYLNRSFDFPPGTLATINISGNLPNGVYNYYALGYPGFAYFNTVNESLLVRQRRFAPFTMTSAASNLQRNNQNILRITNNNKLEHAAPTMKGMSGGPVLRFLPNTNTIEILGVVQSGALDRNFGAKFW